MKITTSPSDTLAEQATATLQNAILQCELEPDSKLRVHDLASQLGFGVTPIREGLLRLVSRGHVVATGNQGFRVSSMSLEDLDDIVRVRTLVELEALRASMQLGDHEWEARVIGALHRLRRFEEVTSWDEAAAGDFESLHKEYHVALISACGSPRLIELQSLLYDQTYRYRHRMMKGVGRSSSIAREHIELTQLVLDRNEAAACAAARAHIQITPTMLYAAEKAKAVQATESQGQPKRRPSSRANKTT